MWSGEIVPSEFPEQSPIDRVRLDYGLSEDEMFTLSDID